MAEGLLTKYIREKYGAYIDTASSLTEVGTSVKSIAQRNFNRFGLVLANMGQNPIFIAPNSSVAYESGICLATNGSSLILEVESDLVLPGFDWYAVSQATGSYIYVLEIIGFAEV